MSPTIEKKRSSLPPGYILGEYRIERVLGSGGFGITYLATDSALERRFAIKEYFPIEVSLRSDVSVQPLDGADHEYEEGLKDFIREARTLARFHHRNIVSVSRIFEANNTAYIVLNFEEGASLKDWLRNRDKPPDQAEIDALAGPLLDALATMHADGTLHRDIAPDNIYVRKDGSPVLLDFGSARQSATMRSHSVSAVVKAGYSAPEQYTTKTTGQGAWTDVYGLAATLYRAIAGSPPPEASDRVLDDEMAPLGASGLRGFRSGFLAAIDWGLALRPGDRPQSIADWQPALMEGRSSILSRPKHSRTLRDGSKNRPAPVARARAHGLWRLGGGLALAAVALGGAGVLMRDEIEAMILSPESRIESLRQSAERAKTSDERTDLEAAAETLRNESFGADQPRLLGLEFAPASGQTMDAASGNTGLSVAGIAPGSPFRGKIDPGEMLTEVTLNNAPLDGSSAAALADAEARLRACDVITAQRSADAAPAGAVTTTIPQDHGPAPNGPGILSSDIGATFHDRGGPGFWISVPGKTLETAGLQSGDLLTAFDGKGVTSPTELTAQLATSFAAGGKYQLGYLRDCAAGTAEVDLGSSPLAEVDWAGLTFAGREADPPVLAAVAADSPLAGLALPPGAELASIRSPAGLVDVDSLATLRDGVAELDLCGRMDVSFRPTAGAEETTASLTIPEPPEIGEFELVVLGLSGKVLAGSAGLRVDQSDGTFWAEYLQPGDIFLSAGEWTPEALAGLSVLQQYDLLAAGSRFVVRRNCREIAVTVPPDPMVSNPVDPASLSSETRRGIVGGLFALGFYRSGEEPANFVETGAPEAKLQAATRAFLQDRGIADRTALAPRDIAEITAADAGPLPASLERSILRSLLPVEVTGDMVAKRIDLSLRAAGLAGSDLRQRLGQYLVARGEGGSLGYVTTEAAARALLVDTLQLPLLMPEGVRNFDKWMYYEIAPDSCVLAATPAEIEGLIFDFDLASTPNDRPILWFSVDRGQRDEGMKMDFGSSDSYDPVAALEALTGGGQRVAMQNRGITFWIASHGTEGGTSDALHKALGRGEWIEIRGQSKYGGPLRIRYPAEGFLEGFHHMRDVCGVAQLDKWLE